MSAGDLLQDFIRFFCSRFEQYFTRGQRYKLEYKHLEANVLYAWIGYPDYAIENVQFPRSNALIRWISSQVIRLFF
jgi:hypothetical protein